MNTVTSRAVSIVARVAAPAVRQSLLRLSLSAFALGLAVSTLSTPSTALAAPSRPGPVAPGPVGPIGPVAPSDDRADLVPFLFQSNTDVQPGQAVYFSVTTKNKGTANAPGSRTVLGLAKEFSNVRVASSPGATCTIQYSIDGWLPGYWVLCDEGAIDAGQSRVIRVEALAPTAPGSYGVTAQVDAKGVVKQSDTTNDTASVKLNVH